MTLKAKARRLAHDRAALAAAFLAAGFAVLSYVLLFVIGGGGRESGFMRQPSAAEYAVLVCLSTFLVLAPAKTVRKPLVAFSVVLLISTAYLLPVLKGYARMGRGDWDQMLTFLLVLKKSIMEYGQFPLWNPFMCGGTPLLANPQSLFMDPALATIFIFNTVIAAKISIVAYFLIGFTGCYLLGGHLGYHAYSRLYMGVTYMMGGYFANRIWEGHLIFFAMAYLPYMLLYLMKSFERARHAVVCAAIVCFAMASLQPWSMAMLPIFLLGYALSVGAAYAMKAGTLKKAMAEAAKPLKAIILVGVISALLFGYRLVPSLDYALEHPRKFSGSEKQGFTPMELIYTLTDSKASDARHERSGYVGAVAVALAAYGVLRSAKDVRLICLIPPATVLLLISLGRYDPLAIWAHLSKLPLYGSLHIVERNIGFIVFALAVFSAKGLSEIEGKSPKFAKACVIFTVFLLSLQNTPKLSQAFLQPPPHNVDGGVFAQTDTGRRGFLSRMYGTVEQGRGIVNCYLPAHIRISAKAGNATGYRGEAYLQNGNGEAALTMFSPNRIHARVDAKKGDILVINQNYEKGWAADGSPAANMSGLLAARVDATTKEVTFEYLPRTFVAGLLLSAAGLIVCLITVKNHGRTIF